jgi:hypothetical protein
MNPEEIESLALALHKRVKERQLNAMEGIRHLPTSLKRMILSRQREINEEDRQAERSVILKNS